MNFFAMSFPIVNKVRTGPGRPRWLTRKVMESRRRPTEEVMESRRRLTEEVMESRRRLTGEIAQDINSRSNLTASVFNVIVPCQPPIKAYSKELTGLRDCHILTLLHSPRYKSDNFSFISDIGGRPSRRGASLLAIPVHRSLFILAVYGTHSLILSDNFSFISDIGGRPSRRGASLLAIPVHRSLFILAVYGTHSLILSDNFSFISDIGGRPSRRGASLLAIPVHRSLFILAVYGAHS
ncbi:hypothetical protein J6590_066617 [Homalodisca vitripennis]|nr:hypothetical protein J6590_066617 [Homalodisca vitripennis]